MVVISRYLTTGLKRDKDSFSRNCSKRPADWTTADRTTPVFFRDYTVSLRASNLLRFKALFLTGKRIGPGGSAGLQNLSVVCKGDWSVRLRPSSATLFLVKSTGYSGSTLKNTHRSTVNPQLLKNGPISPTHQATLPNSSTTERWNKKNPRAQLSEQG